ncbi:hypothetical protein AAHA92_02031 [Salvia divinorum]|uniref:Uncharacterized protein n=1 Tax=Salvia divinorum TaxID=28513 RepID=A0ABD1ICI0_SALDI
MQNAGSAIHKSKILFLALLLVLRKLLMLHETAAKTSRNTVQDHIILKRAGFNRLDDERKNFVNSDV